ncbi:MAG: O-antigen ligase family protein, partial [Taibaiella sp.]|nr:O-antigen ligase family protein [Taibaiella sp.]
SQGVTHVTYRIWFEEFTGIHPPYMSMYLVLATGILFTFKDFKKTTKYICFYGAGLLLLPLLAKSPLIALGIILLHQAFLRRKILSRYKWGFVGAIVLLILSYLFIPFISQRVEEMAGLSGNIKGTVIDNSIYIRKIIWAVDSHMAKHYWLAGVGPGKIMHLLRVRYFFYSLYYGYNLSAYDPHNEYFYQWIALGLTGITALLTTLAVHIYTGFKRNNIIYTYLLLILVVTFFTESVLATQHGVIFYSFFTSLFYFWPTKRHAQ